MDQARIGRSLRALRRRRRQRQADVAHASGVSQSTVSRIELGRLDEIPIATLRRVASALGARFEASVLWNGEGLDRLLDEAHARLVDRIVDALRRWAWDVETEVSFQVRGERGSIDVMGWRPVDRILLVVEAKSVVPDLQSMFMKLDQKQRLAPEIVRGRGWRPVSVARLLVISDDRTARRRVEEHGATFAAAFPVRGSGLHRWLRQPTPVPVSGLWFLATKRSESAGPSSTRGVGGSHATGGRERVRVPRSCVDGAPAEAHVSPASPNRGLLRTPRVDDRRTGGRGR
ncbi:MAG: helix-turn-helix domain-containing protein [Acidimicrobiales bacterium]